VLWLANFELGVLRVHPPGDPAPPHFWSGLQQQLGFEPGAHQRLDGKRPHGASSVPNEAAEPAHQGWVKRLAAELYEAYASEVPPPELDDDARHAVVGVCGHCEWRSGGGVAGSGSGGVGGAAQGGDAEPSEDLLRLQWSGPAEHDTYAMQVALAA